MSTESEPLTSFGDPRLLPVFASLGYFHMWFSAADQWLTVILANLCDAPDAQKFAVAVSGMDSRMKCERLRRAAKLSSLPIGPCFRSWLDDFEKKSVPFRNKISHRLLLPSQDGKGFYVTPFGEGDHMLAQKHPDVSASLLMNHAIWLQAFAEVIDEIAHAWRQARTLETAVLNPRPPMA